MAAKDSNQPNKPAADRKRLYTVISIVIAAVAAIALVVALNVDTPPEGKWITIRVAAHGADEKDTAKIMNGEVYQTYLYLIETGDITWTFTDGEIRAYGTYIGSTVKDVLWGTYNQDERNLTLLGYTFTYSISGRHMTLTTEDGKVSVVLDKK